MNQQEHTRTIAILAVDGHQFEIAGCYQGEERHPRAYQVNWVGQNQAIKLDSFPSHNQLRRLVQPRAND
ncbi:hypothetical protein [Balneatrix alpica]|uniref:hypothetical protein n=1 Tax=Balneatrix alpica TaxID=75684 RepID=UPI002739D61E|nr:hypothetical protein [Balneatrix alpica]